MPSLLFGIVIGFGFIFWISFQNPSTPPVATKPPSHRRQSNAHGGPRFRYEEPGANLSNLPFRREKGLREISNLGGIRDIQSLDPGCQNHISGTRKLLK